MTKILNFKKVDLSFLVKNLHLAGAKQKKIDRIDL